jgi:rhamnogalacturonan endolyase
MKFSSVVVAVFGIWAVGTKAIKLTTTDAAYTVDAGSANPFTFTVKRSSCDVTSIKYLGSEVQYQSQASHISSGLGTATVSATSITCK